MTVFIILLIICVGVYYILDIVVNQIIDNYLETRKIDHLEPIGIDENAFIGLHKKALEIDNTYMIYARKTTAYKGVILFSPDGKLTYRFYLPLINYLCRQGYIIVAHQNKHDFYTQGINDMEALYQLVINDEVLGTYPISCLGHGTGAYIQLCANLPKVLNKVAFQPANHEIYEMISKDQKLHPYLRKRLYELLNKKYQCDFNREAKISCPTYIIIGAQDQHQLLTLDDANIKILSGNGHYPFLNMDSEQRILSLDCLLCYPGTAQYDYNKAIETFDTSVLYDLNQEVLEILPYLFEYEDTTK